MVGVGLPPDSVHCELVFSLPHVQHPQTLSCLCETGMPLSEGVHRQSLSPGHRPGWRQPLPSTHSCSAFEVLHKLRLWRELTPNVAIIGATRYYVNERKTLDSLLASVLLVGMMVCYATEMWEKNKEPIISSCTHKTTPNICCSSITMDKEV